MGAHNFISAKTAASERCQLQLVKAAMVAGDWSQGISYIEDLFQKGSDRIREGHVLMGECRYRAARAGDDTGSSKYKLALESFGAALSFLPTALYDSEAEAVVTATAAAVGATLVPAQTPTNTGGGGAAAVAGAD